ncbi:MAG: fimbrillin family protein [Prevotella sp.]|nr:fimbrillin family protein [Prevotella sp.]
MITKRRNLVFRFLPGLFLSGLLLLSGCSQDDVSNVPAGSRAIGFRAQGGMSSLKATTSGLGNIQSFAVNAHHSEADWDADNFLLHGTTVYRGEGGNSWKYSPTVYFPSEESGSVEFFAYSPSGTESIINEGLKNANGSSQEITYKVPAPLASSSTTFQEDLLVACTQVSPAGYTDPVSLQFRHALSRVQVRAAKTEALKEISIVITGLKLRNLYSQGTLSLRTALSGWGHNAGQAGTTVLWSGQSVLADYPYQLPESGVFVGVDSKLVTGADQGLFVLPQTTKGDPSQNLPVDDVDKENGEFGLEVSYSLNGSADDITYLQFSDIAANDEETGVTFEIGRQYILDLTFGGGSGGSGGTGDITLKPAISFGDFPEVDGLGDPLDVVAAKPAVPPYWAASNIYFRPDDGEGGSATTGVLTFAESGTAKQNYQGVFFQWGSLIGVDPVTVGSINADTYLFIPDDDTPGKYHKVKIGEVSAASGIDNFRDAVTGWTGGVTATTDWPLIPHVSEAVTTGRDFDALADFSNSTGYAAFKGDICRYLSANRYGYNATAILETTWKMPVSDMFGNDNAYGTNYTWTAGAGTSSSNVDGALASGLHYVTYSHARGDAPEFPASGYRGTMGPDPLGFLISVGFDGNYWSSSAFSGTLASRLIVGSGEVGTGAIQSRGEGLTVRCLRE